MNKPKIYVSGPSRDLERCEGAIALCVELGAEITYDWTVGFLDALKKNDPEDHRARALADLAGIRAADVMILLDSDSTSPGRWVEAGGALILGTPVIASVPESARTPAAEFWPRLMETTTSDESAIYRAVLLGRKRAVERAGRRLRQVRERAGLSPAQTKRITGLDVMAIEDGSCVPNIRDVAVLATAYGVTACWLSGHDASVDLTDLARQAQDKGVSPGDFAEIATMAQTLAVCSTCHTDAVSSAP